MDDFLALLNEEIQSIDIDNEKPTEALKNTLEQEIDQSQLPGHYEKMILMNLDRFNITQFWYWFWFIKEFQVSEDPRKLFVNFLKTMQPLGLTKYD